MNYIDFIQVFLGGTHWKLSTHVYFWPVYSLKCVSISFYSQICKALFLLNSSFYPSTWKENLAQEKGWLKSSGQNHCHQQLWLFVNCHSKTKVLFSRKPMKNFKSLDPLSSFWVPPIPSVTAAPKEPYGDLQRIAQWFQKELARFVSPKCHNCATVQYLQKC